MRFLTHVFSSILTAIILAYYTHNQDILFFFAFGGILPDLFHGRDRRSPLSHSVVYVYILALFVSLLVSLPKIIIEGYITVENILRMSLYIYAGALYHLLLDYPTGYGIYVLGSNTRFYIYGSHYDNRILNTTATLLPLILVIYILTTDLFGLSRTILEAMESLYMVVYP